MGDLAVVPPSTMSLIEQADFILALHDRCTMSDGDPAKETFMSLTKEDGDTLAAIGHRLARMSAHEAGIRALVTGRSE